ncbi:hypothetical protein [Phytohalomonas tamaricis]|uniref:hypothetical protein n=1 Tax=Phytohalomonas tamaricis TaxID=2081032 RepID=UPI00131A23D5|nr:hypothetical protein [Phytohalomonas tamaricis]
MPRNLPPLMFTERRRNTAFLLLALIITLTGAVMLVMLGQQQNRLGETAPVVAILGLWGMMLAGNLYKRRKLSPILRIEDTRIRYLGGPAFAPRLHDIPFADIEAIDRINASAVRLRLKGKKRKRSIPTGLLSLEDRKRFESALHERLAL